ncbi:MAG TPA: tetratricopeptide repeat protein, partial [Planctomycetota bacterium]|nr:tetratricopeptide repeat protein [Planctomycetota bacterium]
MFKRCVIAAVVVVGVSGVCAGERWLIERGPTVGQPDRAVDAAAIELLLRSKLSELRSVTLLSKGDVKWDVSTLELVRLHSAKGETRVTLGKFARARALIAVDVLGVPGHEGFRVSLRVIDLSQENREQTFEAKVEPPGPEAAVTKLALDAGAFLGRKITPDELARMNRPTRLTADALVALAKSLDAKTPVERELFTRLATAHAPEASLAWYLHARALHETGRPLEAISAYRRAIRIDDAGTACHYDLGNAFFDEKRYDEAAAEYRRVITLDPAHAAAHENLVRALAMQKLAPDDLLAKYRETTA